MKEFLAKNLKRDTNFTVTTLTYILILRDPDNFVSMEVWIAERNAFLKLMLDL